ncbi:MAG TPA: hypothetical protein VNJ04_01790 [Gemmatimonadaceae bacterium]|nr:hypothetical protein [Gemmatimonadaceae bacterium]
MRDIKADSSRVNAISDSLTERRGRTALLTVQATRLSGTLDAEVSASGDPAKLRLLADAVRELAAVTIPATGGRP